MADTRKTIDWEKVEFDYRAGILSLREIGAKYGCSDTAVRKKAKREAWERDLSAKIESKVRAELVRAEVRAEVRAASKASERELIESNAQAILSIRLSHRADISRAKKLVSKLFHEVEKATVVDGQDHPAEVLTIPQRVDCVRKLTDSAKTLITLEREAWSINGNTDAEKALTVNITSSDLEI